MDPSNPNNRKVTRATEAAVRREMVEALRHFTVEVPARAADGTSTTAVKHVMAHRHMLLGNGTVLGFAVDTENGTYVRRLFRFWKDVEEIVTPDGGRSATGKAN